MKYILVLLLLLSSGVKAESICEGYRPLHAAWGLSGSHWSCSCDSCHKGGVWKGTPKTCVECHTGARPPAIGRPLAHIPTGMVNCSMCHNTLLFSQYTMVHDPVFISPPGSCSTCHEAGIAGVPGKSSRHPQTTLSCDQCHNTRSFDFKHPAIATVAGNCNSCHTSGPGRVKPVNHIPTITSCDVCHNNVISFTGGVYQHTGVETCEVCHTGIYLGAIGKNSVIMHPATPDNCGSCHSISGWPCRSGMLNNTFDRFALKLIKWWLA